MKRGNRLLIVLLVLLVGYGVVYVVHPMPFIIKLDIQSAEIVNKDNVILFKTDNPQKVDEFLNLFKYNRPYLPWQSGSGWKKITPETTKLPPNIGIVFKNDLGEVRYGFFIRFDDPSYVEMRTGFYLPWSKTFFPINPNMNDWQTIAGEKIDYNKLPE